MSLLHVPVLTPLYSADSVGGIPARRSAAGLLRVLADVRRERHDDLRRVRRVDRARRVVRGAEDRVRRRPLLRHAGTARVGVLVREAVGQLVEVAHDDGRRERLAAVRRLRQQHLVVVVSGARRVRRRGVVVRPYDVEVPVGPGERLRERVLVALAVRRRRPEDRVRVDARRDVGADEHRRREVLAVVARVRLVDVRRPVAVVQRPRHVHAVLERAAGVVVHGHVLLVEQAAPVPAVSLNSTTGRPGKFHDAPLLPVERKT